jgi:hypothetical protein
METNPTHTQARALYQDIKPLFENLYCRWLDEREYEDIQDYRKVLQDAIDGSTVPAKITKMLKRPFGFRFVIDGTPCQISMKGGEYIVLKISRPTATTC